jgi:hypothetical protein
MIGTPLKKKKKRKRWNRFRSESSIPGRAIYYSWRAASCGCIMKGWKTAKGPKNRIENRSHHHHLFFVCPPEGGFFSVFRFRFLSAPPEGGLGSSWLKHALKQRPGFGFSVFRFFGIIVSALLPFCAGEFNLGYYRPTHATRNSVKGKTPRLSRQFLILAALRRVKRLACRSPVKGKTPRLSRVLHRSCLNHCYQTLRITLSYLITT